ncbi:survival protein sure-like phosphatase/nucleotidase [Lineolata rhizophorae]|uniref:Survival protein sure-like phosphatase/nucleotidase n=1 Tax=Lineolata rhizophorae TaxID=578093 RepID=A0A6A6NTH6_9PEZI|nr:survival protein sure-like phosphatase/nucleotidase [Lineolata rhizophorae]
MRSSIAAAGLAALTVVPSVQATKVLLNNDDGWWEANLRETYRLLSAEDGFDVLLVAPVTGQSGTGGSAEYSEDPYLSYPGQYDSVPAGSPAVGHEPDNDRIWYYNGTPAACDFVAFDYVIPQIWGNGTLPDLVVTGPNTGHNLGPFVFTLSGTVGAAYAAVSRNVPAIAVSAGDVAGGHRPYTEVNETTPAGLKDPATIHAELTVKFVKELVQSTRSGNRFLPLAYGLSVNIPDITSMEDDSCIDPPFVQTRLTGSAITDIAAQEDESSSEPPVFHYESIYSDAVNECINGDCDLPGETAVVEDSCTSSVSVFTIDYDAPDTHVTKGVWNKLKPLVKGDEGSGHHWRRRGANAKYLGQRNYRRPS